MFVYYKCYITIELTLLKQLMLNKISSSKECDICHNWYIFDKGFKFQPDVCSGFHDLLMMSVKLCDIAILNNKGADYRCFINELAKGSP